jgi:hypothetical protein
MALSDMSATAPLLTSAHENRAPSPIWNMTAFRAAGLGAVSCTWASADPVRETGVLAGREPVHTGRAVLNPNFLHDSTAHVELMLTLGDPPWRPTMADCLILTRICRDVLALAAEAGSVLFLHSPVAPASEVSRSRRGDGSEEVPRDAQGPSLRMLIGIENVDTSARLSFELGVTRLAQRYGLGLWLADRRVDRSRGEWFRIRGFSRETYRATRDESFRGTAGRLPRRGQVLSSVGPARQGIALAIVERLITQNVGLVGMSVSALQGVGFVNYFLAVDEPQREALAPGRPSPGEDSWQAKLSEIKAHLEFGSDASDATRLPQGYELTLGPARRCYFPTSSRSTGAGRDARAPYPLWLAWEGPAQALGAPDVLGAMSERIGANTDSHRLLYAQSRLVSPELMRGRAKFSVVLAEHKDNAPLAQDMLKGLADTVEGSMIDWLSVDRHLPQARCRVSAKERWLRYARTIR